MTEPPATPAEVTAFGLKLPPFWVSCPEAWFLVVESHFDNRKITSDATKYNHVVTSLPSEVSTSVLDILRKPPTEHKYQNIKEKLIQRHSMSEEKRLEELLQNAEQGDRSPSNFYRELEQLAISTTGVDSKLLQKLWLRKLPPSIKIAVTAYGKTDIDDILTLADRIWDVSGPQIQAITTSTPKPSTSVQSEMIEAFSKLAVSMDILQKEVAEIKRYSAGRVTPQERNEQVCSRCRNRSSSRNRRRYSNPRDRSLNRAGTHNSPCWYHSRFGENSTRCMQPCNYSSSQNFNTNNNLNH